MLSVKENTTLIGVSELRTKLDEILKKMETSKVIIEKRNHPIAILMSFEEYDRTQSILDLAEELMLGYLARERFKKSKPSDYLDLDVVEKKLGLR